MLILQAAQSKASLNFPHSFLLMTCGPQRALNAIPPRADEPDYREKIADYYIKPEIKLWIAELSLPQTACDSESEEIQNEADTWVSEKDNECEFSYWNDTLNLCLILS